MKFLCDVHISYRFVRALQSFGFEVLHINQILNKWFTSDKNICDFSDQNDMILITKDLDFKNSWLLKQTPKKLIRINLGNISTDELIRIFKENMDEFRKFEKKPVFYIEVHHDFIEYL